MKNNIYNKLKSLLGFKGDSDKSYMFYTHGINSDGMIEAHNVNSLS